MGIQNLLITLKPIEKQRHLSEYRGQTAGVDGYVFLHKAVYACAPGLLNNDPVAFAQMTRYCMSRIKQLQTHGIKPYVVFDGAPLPAKRATETERAKKRQIALEKGQFMQAVEVTPYMAKLFADELDKTGVTYLVAPYEADAQLAKLSMEGIVDFVISEDSDLLTYGCTKVLYKLDPKNNRGIEIDRTLIFQSLKIDSDALFKMFCILCGCDYLPSLPGISAKKDLLLAQKCVGIPTVDSLLRLVRYSGIHVSQEYEASFEHALNTFNHQTVFDLKTQRLTPLTNVVSTIENRSFLGQIYNHTLAASVAACRLDPLTYLPFERPANSRKRLRSPSTEDVIEIKNSPPKVHQRIPIDQLLSSFTYK